MDSMHSSTVTNGMLWKYERERYDGGPGGVQK